MSGLSETISDDELVSYAAGTMDLPRALKIYELSKKDAVLAANIQVVSFGGGVAGEKMALNHLSGGLLVRTTKAADDLANWVYANAENLSAEQRRKLVDLLSQIEKFQAENPLQEAPEEE